MAEAHATPSAHEAYLQNALSQIQNKERPELRRMGTQIDVVQCKQRIVADVPEPAWFKPTDEQFFMTDPVTGAARPNPAFLREHFLREGRLTEAQAVFLVHEATRLLTLEPNLLELHGPISVCGDIHGQYYDMMKVFDVGGDVANNTYLFLGDYVDRGSFGIECLLYLYSLKICHPDRIFLLRGNHECQNLTQYFTFHRECTRKYTLELYNACTQSFRALPLSAVLDKRFLCVHGGISPELNTLSDILKVDRHKEPPDHGLLCDLLWADPAPNFGNEPPPANGAVADSFLPNPARGCSYFFTYEAACNFLERNNLLGIIRGHEVQQHGYQMYKKTRSKKFPSVITIFTAPNYCDFYHNRGAVLKYVDKNITIRQFNATTHPYWLPNFMDAFTWSLPFVGDKIVQMLIAILHCCTAEELEETDSEDEVKTTAMMEAAEGEEAVAQRRAAIKNKILAVGKMRRMFQVLREEAETASELNSAMEESGHAAARARGAVDDEQLGVRGNQMRRAIRSFDDARRSDKTNERMPEFHFPSPSIPSFPMVQAPSTRARSSVTGAMDDTDIEARLRRSVQDFGEEGGEDAELVDLADRISQARRAPRPGGLRRYGTV